MSAGSDGKSGDAESKKEFLQTETGALASPWFAGYMLVYHKKPETAAADATKDKDGKAEGKADGKAAAARVRDAAYLGH